jgi:signal transduction histidine kinase
MRAVDSLKRRIVVAFLLFGLVSSIFFGVIAAVVVEGIEVHLVDNRLAAVAAWALPREVAGFSLDMPAGMRFHRNAGIPAPLQHLNDGVHILNVDGLRLHVLAGRDAAGRYVVVDHESDYDEIELVVYSMFALCVAGFLLFAAILGRFLGTRVVTPIRQLADSIGARQQPQQLTERQDELGLLARALESHTAELRAFLDRERFFTGDVSHELRSPLTVIMGAAEILMDESHAPAVRAPAERIYRAAREASECVTVLLLLARAPELTALEHVAVDDIASAEVERYRALVATKPVALNFIESAGFSVRAPRELVAAAIGNLVRNACQYTEQGEVRVSVTPGQVVVEDTGPGLPPAVRETLGKGGAVPSSGSAGTGLGLALARRICDYLHAQLGFEERTHGGTRFTITFASDLTRS